MLKKGEPKTFDQIIFACQLSCDVLYFQLPNTFPLHIASIWS